mmetsp:Transcript_3637/g.10366  ORF Transcript_3637/g.10366 Transcript_3637/m.10366 type:complete len:178 (+) Transcript_3637:122-655(+)|eukprot:CAMPEP_0181057090 /NCGR_PEP_ID=MMETSP1070-20121207/20060_1 /TAXON_ID=265543 /ORGANISM="Minutocellus polymorphus, Strain NH13" /LENGTH=177 /DNA_ID=CAMNT_0023136471 /DNA_START=93 /DNA_END=626 /DNA_ORIENTATION=-
MFQRNFTRHASAFFFSTLYNLASAQDDADLGKPFLMRNIEFGDITLPVSPATVILFLIVAIVMFRGVTQSASATARHILIDDHSEETKKRLEKMKEEINNDKKKFAACASKYSKCPSGKAAGGSLGKFGQGSMVPPFDRVVFDPKTKIGVVVGPVHTNFGWHLILIEERDELRQYKD